METSGLITGWPKVQVVPGPCQGLSCGAEPLSCGTPSSWVESRRIGWCWRRHHILGVRKKKGVRKP